VGRLRQCESSSLRRARLDEAAPLRGGRAGALFLLGGWPGVPALAGKHPRGRTARCVPIPRKPNR
jgi:hypothetical protein